VKQLFTQQIDHPLKVSLVVALLFVFAQVAAQDIHFSQIDAADLVTVNPANTGNYDGDWKFGGLYRSQWPSIEKAFSSSTAFYDQQIGDKLSGGIVLINDQAGIVRLNTNKLYLSGAYRMSFGADKEDNNSLRLGLQLGGVYKNVDPNSLSFPGQFDANANSDLGGYFNPALDNEETGLNNSLFYMDINIGANFRFNKSGKVSPAIGLAVLHVNNPKDSFLGAKEKLPQRYVADIGLHWKLKEQAWLYPYAMTTFHAKANETLFGVDLILSFYENPTTLTGFFLGIASRSNLTRAFQDNTTELSNDAGLQDAFIAKFGVEMGNIRLGFSYDQNVSTFQTATDGFGAVELSLIYMAKTTKLREIQVPCDRF